jgi:hypothetical protein
MNANCKFKDCKKPALGRSLVKGGGIVVCPFCADHAEANGFKNIVLPPAPEAKPAAA